MTSLLPEPVLADVDGVPVATYVLSCPEPAGDIVFCHGTPWSAAVWADVAAALSRTHRVHLWDMPGYGRSPKVAEVDLSTQMQRFARLLDGWRLDRPHVVAHDIGGAVALGAHLLYDAQYADLFLWDVVTLDPWGSPFLSLVAEHEDVFARLPPRLHDALVREYIAGATHGGLSSDWLDTLTEPWRGEGGQAAFYRQIARLSPADTRPVAARLAEVRCPVEIGWGQRDPWIPVGQSVELRDLLPSSPRVHELPEAGHLVPVEDAAAVVAVLRDWLLRLDAR